MKNEWLWISEWYKFERQIINEDESDLHNYEHYLSISENKAWKKN